MTETKPTATRASFWSFLVRWQEHTGWLPLSVALAVLAWIFFGALDRAAASDTLPILAMLPIKLAYAIAACGVLFLVRRRWRRKLTPTEQADLWKQLVDGHRGPMAIYFGDLVFTLCALYWLLKFFLLPA